MIGFAAETDDLMANAQAKLRRKNADWIVANDVSPATGIMGGAENAVHLVSAAGIEAWPAGEGRGRRPPGPADRGGAALTWTLRPLGLEDADRLLPLRLEALRKHPEAFGADVSEEGPAVIGRLIGRHPSVTLGGFVGETMVGMAGLAVPDRIKARHKGHVWGFYVTPAFRRSGLSGAMMAVLIEHARRIGLLGLTLTVTVGNDAARRLYAGYGFRSYGVEPGGLFVDGRFYDVEQMALTLADRDDA